MSKPVTPKRIALASERLANADVAAEACRKVGLPFWAACALLEKESGGRNVYGHDKGGVFSRDQHATVTDRNFFAFLVRVMNGETSNGVGPCQITYAGPLDSGGRDGGFFRVMAEDGHRPWVPLDNMVFGFGLLAEYHEATGSWRAAGKRYNGADAYGVDLVTKCNEWRKLLGIRGRAVT